MTDPQKPTKSPAKWLWPAVIVGLTVLVVAVFLNPSGERDGTVRDPIFIEDTGEGTGIGESPDDAGTARPDQAS
ncbi:MAG: hypothetical protein ACXIT4_09805 [Erythrobacter sp.]